ncbi:hypothetical protein E2C01_072081 [Portunus trituberculatus]|uniref:Uncharacterized protein n=1 Tax=Portunus trituberculatus TaxID=210409 RepID=A0A5B7I5S6_PORTR|nr:hypothetical protein [Portunus trituberculatus]
MNPEALLVRGSRKYSSSYSCSFATSRPTQSQRNSRKPQRVTHPACRYCLLICVAPSLSLNL